MQLSAETVRMNAQLRKYPAPKDEIGRGKPDWNLDPTTFDIGVIVSLSQDDVGWMVGRHLELALS